MKKPRGILLAGNWKMNKSPRETAAFLKDVSDGARKNLPLELIHRPVRFVCFPPSVSLSEAQSHSGELALPIEFGAQNAHFEKSGAFTGEISGPMLQEMGVRWVLVGHSERRALFGETSESAGKRCLSLLQQGFNVMLCVGETRAEREGGKTAVVLHAQLQHGLPASPSGIEEFLDGRLVIAYEPVWAIGTGLTATPEQAEETHQVIRKWLWDRFGMEASARTPILYGGSVTPDTIQALLSCANIDGALVGGASIKVDSYLALVRGALTLAG